MLGGDLHRVLATFPDDRPLPLTMIRADRLVDVSVAAGVALFEVSRSRLDLP